MSLNQKREAPDAVTSNGGRSRKALVQNPLYSKRRPKPQVPDSTREVWQLGLVPRLTSDSCMEFALTKKGGRVRFRFTEVAANGQRHRFHLDPSELLATVSAIHKGRSIMGAVT